MKARLIIKNFGPITDLDIEIKKYNILIGPKASGKSTIAKLLCVIHDYFKDTILQKPYTLVFSSPDVNEKDNRGFDIKSINIFTKILFNYRIASFHLSNTYLFFEDNSFKFEFKDERIFINYKAELEEENIFVGSYYIPPERIALPMISESLFQLTLEQSSLPPSFLRFGSDFTIARGLYKSENSLPVFDLSFEYREGRNFIKLQNEKSILLEEASSAIQSNIPLLMVLEHPIRTASMVAIEELELHSFPKLQKQLLYHVIEKTREQTLSNAYVVLPTHSPYILSAANNLLFANKVGNQSEKTRLETNKIINQASWIDRDDFAAYYIDNGTAKSIVNGQTGLIDENELDSISEDLGEEFDLLMDLYKPAHA